MKITAKNGVTVDHRNIRSGIMRGLKVSARINKRQNRKNDGAVTCERVCKQILRRLANRPGHYRLASA